MPALGARNQKKQLAVIKALEDMPKSQRIDTMMFAKLIEACEYLNVSLSITAEDWNDIPFHIKFFMMDVLEKGQTASQAYDHLLRGN